MILKVIKQYRGGRGDGWLITVVDGGRRREIWTAGSRRDAVTEASRASGLDPGPAAILEALLTRRLRGEVAICVDASGPFNKGDL